MIKHGLISSFAIMLLICDISGAVVQDSSTQVFYLNLSVIFETIVSENSAVFFTDQDDGKYLHCYF